MVRTYEYKIRTYHTDVNGRLFLHHLFNLLQDVAHNDATSLGFGLPQLLRQNKFWVLSRLSMEIEKLPKYDDKVIIKTWVKSVSGVRSEREFAIELDGEKIIGVTTLWFCLSGKNHRPASIPDEDRLLKLVNDEYSVSGGAIKVDDDISGLQKTQGIHLKARSSDIDMVGHVNNAAYVRWVMDEARVENPTGMVKEFSINYLNEVFLNDRLEITHAETSNGELITDVFKVGSDKSSCRTKTVWH